MADQTFNVSCGFFNAVDHDRTYFGDQMNNPYKRLVADGVFATPQGEQSTDLQVKANAGMQIVVYEGDAIFAGKWFQNDAKIYITVPSNTNINSRIDSVIAQVDTRLSGRVGNIVYRTGDPAASPEPPEINQTAGVKEWRLANITVAPNVTEITDAVISGRRGTADCPWVTALIQQVDTSTLYDQWDAAFQEFYENSTEDFTEYFDDQKAAFEAGADATQDELTAYSITIKNRANAVVYDIQNDYRQEITDFETAQESDFTAWFNEMKGQLSEDAAGNLQNQITAIAETYMHKTGKVLLFNEALAMLSANPVTAAAFQTYPYILGIEGTASGLLYIFHTDRTDNGSSGSAFSCTIAHSTYDGETVELDYTVQTPSFSPQNGLFVGISHVGGDLYQVAELNNNPAYILDVSGVFYSSADVYKMPYSTGNYFVKAFNGIAGTLGIGTASSSGGSISSAIHIAPMDTEETTITGVDVTGTIFTAWSIGEWGQEVTTSFISVYKDNNHVYVAGSGTISKISGSTLAWTSSSITSGYYNWDAFTYYGDYLYIAYNKGKLTKMSRSDGSVIWTKVWNKSGVSSQVKYIDVQEGIVYIYATPQSGTGSAYIVELETDSADRINQGDVTLTGAGYGSKAGEYVFFPTGTTATGDDAPILRTKRTLKYDYIEEV